MVDVNTGKYVGEDDLQETIVNTNIEAAREIARQLRLRDIGGMVVIDFVDMEGEENEARVVAALEEALKADRTKTNVVGFTGLGLVEMTRKKCAANSLRCFWRIAETAAPAAKCSPQLLWPCGSEEK